MSQQMLFYRGASVLLITRERQKPSGAYTLSPTKGELLINVMAVAVQPAEYKIQKGILPFQLTYPTINCAWVIRLFHLPTSNATCKLIARFPLSLVFLASSPRLAQTSCGSSRATGWSRTAEERSAMTLASEHTRTTLSRLRN